MLNVDIGYLGSLSIVFRMLTARHQVFAKLRHISELGRKAVTTNLDQLSFMTKFSVRTTRLWQERVSNPRLLAQKYADYTTTPPLDLSLDVFIKDLKKKLEQKKNFSKNNWLELFLIKFIWFSDFERFGLKYYRLQWCIQLFVICFF